MFQAAADGEIKALWIACTNPAQSMPDQATVRRALDRAEFVVVQEAFATTSTCDYADLLLPATTWGEKDGTVTNSERRISRVRSAVGKPGTTRHDWEIAAEFGRRLEVRLGRSPSLFPYQAPEAIWLEHRASTRGRDLDITGLSYARLDAAPQQWPFPAGATTGRARLYEDGIFPTPDGKARFAAVTYQPLAEPRESRYPFSLTTGRLRDQWHGMSRTGTLGRLFGHVPEPVVQMNAQDISRRGLQDGDLVHVTSRRGSIVLPVQASGEIGLSQAFIAMHWGSEFLSGVSSTGMPLAGVNALTTSACCPGSKQPELKHAAVKILKAELPWTLLAVGWLPGDTALDARERLKALMQRFPFASCVPFSRNAPLEHAATRERTGVLFRAAAHEPPPEELLLQLEQILGLVGAEVLRYVDRRRGQRRTIRAEHDGVDLRLQALLLAGDTSAEAWLKALLVQELPAQAYGRLLLSPGAKAPVAVRAKGKQVCSCLGVEGPVIEDYLARCAGTAEARLASLQGALRCGTNCGSCVPELKRMVRAVQWVRQAA
jgi:assimilatory nitrate reductase catalytic subunit